MRTALLLLLMLAVLSVNAAPVLHMPAEFTSFPLAGKTETLLTDLTAKFTSGKNEWVWISDAEHMVWDETGERFLADNTTRPMCLARDRIPARRNFELFPYHYYRRKDYTTLHSRPLNYQLVARNETTQSIMLSITGQGTTRNWDHESAWQGALRGDSATTISLAPGQTHILWDARGLQPDLPWSAIVLGQATGDLMVYDFCFLGDTAPTLDKHQQMPDLAWPPYLLASFTRGTADWNSAAVDILPADRTAAGALRVSHLLDQLYSVALAYSPGGPITKLSEYKYVSPSFARDSLMVRDPVTSYSHHFFGGNYPIMYKLATPIMNDTSQTVTIRLWLCSNDRFGVDSFVGVWSPELRQMAHARVPMMPKNNRWNAVSLTLAPGQQEALNAILIPLGSRWGGFVASIDVEPTTRAK